MHWDEAFALEVGAPGADDYGPERCSWLTHHLTNWIGDDGFLRKSKCQIRRHNPDGDVIFIDGAVSRVITSYSIHYTKLYELTFWGTGGLQGVLLYLLQFGLPSFLLPLLLRRKMRNNFV